MNNDGYPSLGCKEAIGIVVAVIIFAVALVVRVNDRWVAPSIVKASEVQRYELISVSDWVGTGTTSFQFTTFHDKESGQEFVCTINDAHYAPSCIPTGRNWK
jgi:hypothetical protein